MRGMEELVALIEFKFSTKKEVYWLFNDASFCIKFCIFILHVFRQEEQKRFYE